MSKPIPQPNYTQVPNVILDVYLTDLKEAELKVVLWIARQTFGWHRESDKLSLSQLQKATGLSRQGVLNGLKAGMEHGFVERTPHGQSFLYSLVVNEVDQLIDQVVNEVDQSLVNEVDTQNKGVSKETSETNIGAVAPEPEKPKRALTVWQEQVKVMAETIAEQTGDDLNVEQTKRRVGQIAAQLLKAGYGVSDVLGFKEHWKYNDWRGKQGQRPTREQVLSELPRWATGKKSAPTSRRPDQASIDFVERKRREGKL